MSLVEDMSLEELIKAHERQKKLLQTGIWSFLA